MCIRDRILLAGVLLAHLLSGLVRGAAEGVGLEYAHGLARLAQGLVIIISISVAIGQLEVKTDLLNNVIAIVLISVGLAVALALVLGGAIGNLYDRIVLGHVVDFILVHWQNRHYFPAFNVADSAITVGAVMLALDMFKSKKSEDPVHD